MGFYLGHGHLTSRCVPDRCAEVLLRANATLCEGDTGSVMTAGSRSRKSGSEVNISGASACVATPMQRFARGSRNFGWWAQWVSRAAWSRAGPRPGKGKRLLPQGSCANVGSVDGSANV